MRVALHKDGRLLEAQSGDGASMDALKRNIQASGFTLDEAEFIVMPDADVARLIEKQNADIPKPKSVTQIIVDYLADKPDAPDELKAHATKAKAKVI